MSGLGLGLGLTSRAAAGGTIAASVMLDSASVAEDANVGDLVGNLSVLNGSGSYTFSITADPDSKFQLDAGDDSILEVGGALDYETATSHLVTIEADNGVDDPISRQFTILVTNVIDVAPDQFGAGDWSVADLGTNGDIAITIATLPDPGDGPITDLEYQVDGGGWSSLGDVVTGVYPLTGFTDGTEYDIAIRAVNAAGGGTASATKAVTPTGIPDAFEAADWSVADATTGGQLDVTISSLPAANGSAVTDIEYRVDGGSWVSSGGTSDFSITGLTDDVEVDIELQAVNANGDSGAGDLKSETPTTAGGGATISLQSGVGFAGSVYESTAAGQWTADGVNISGETGSTYTMEIEYEGQRISQVGAVNGHELWVPQNITGWGSSFDAALMDIRRNITESGGAVSQWDDVDGVHAFAQGTADNQPAYSATSFNGGPGLTGDGNDILRASIFTGAPAGFTMVNLFRYDGTVSGDFVDGENAGNIRWRYLSIPKYRMTVNGAGNPFQANPTVDTEMLLGALWDPDTSYDMSEFGVSIQSGTPTSDIPGGTDDGLSIGAMSGVHSSMVIIASVVSAGDYEKLHGYLAHANANAGLLDAGHTYKSTPPTVEAL